MNDKQKQVHFKLSTTLPVKTHYRKWPEKRTGANGSYADRKESGRKGRQLSGKWAI